MTRIALNSNAAIIDELNGTVTINTGTDSAPGAEFGFGADGTFSINGTQFTGGDAPTLPAGPLRVSLADNGDVNVQTGPEGSDALFTFTTAGKIKVNGVELQTGAPAAAADPAWINATLLSGWKNATSANAYPIEPVKYRRNGNKIEFSGVLDGTGAATPSQTNQVLTLPAQLAPLVQYQKSMAVCVNGNVMGNLKVFSDGSTIKAYFVAGVQSAGGNITVNLGGAYFYLDKATA